MKRTLVSSTKFEKAYKKFVKFYPYLQKTIDNALFLLEEDMYSPKLSTHKLAGNFLDIMPVLVDLIAE